MTPFTSDLTVDEHHAIRSVGFAPVGLVLGSCVYQIGYTGGYCGYGRSYGRASVVEATGIRQSLYDARMLALSRMQQESAQLGGDGVVAVRLEIRPYPAGGLEFQAIGTAIRADGTVRPRHPFLSDLTGQDFAKLLMAGWVPTGLVLGLSVMVIHQDWNTQQQTANSWVNNEVAAYTALVQYTRQHVRAQLADECAGSGGTGVVVRTSTLNHTEWRCVAGQYETVDHVAEALMIGTAITQFRPSGGVGGPPPLPIMRLT